MATHRCQKGQRELPRSLAGTAGAVHHILPQHPRQQAVLTDRSVCEFPRHFCWCAETAIAPFLQSCTSLMDDSVQALWTGERTLDCLCSAGYFFYDLLVSIFRYEGMVSAPASLTVPLPRSDFPWPRPLLRCA